MTRRDSQPPRIRKIDLPDASQHNVTFYESSFFKQHDGFSSQQAELPTPQEVLARSRDGIGGVVKFEFLGLAVKSGPSDVLNFEEAQAMMAIRRAYSHGEVPVPEVFGWKTHETRRFIYMSLIEGKTLREAWDDLSTADKKEICAQLSKVVSLLRSIEQDPAERQYIGSVSGGVVQDRFFRVDYEKGPFYDIKSFNDWLLVAATRQTPGPNGEIDTNEFYRSLLPDIGEIYFTHGDISLGNVIISNASGTWQIVGLIDWEQAGWYPDFWEYYKMCSGVEYNHEWREAEWIDAVLSPINNDTMDAIAAYFSWRQP
ncbi:hypothetical protein CBER1_10085 [Cercospora berteroae]|uniref:Aminoglycoside phosphotransferase domain-containing protein n=1 Tax=Cercospora berteroae TaxID=357750 RepID=A0A2S6BWX9_9PEZI|nr:hypothetical protein CBER1_10085 [Cercospora berteroae]